MNPFSRLLIKLFKKPANNYIRSIIAESEEDDKKRRENTLRSLQPSVDIPDEKPMPAETAPVKTGTVPAKAETAQNEEIQYEVPTIFRPTHFTAVPHKIPAVELTSKEASELGYSFRKSAKSVKITGFHGQAPQKLIIPCSIASLPVEEICSEVFKEAALDTVFIPDSIRKLGRGVFMKSTVTNAVFGSGLSSIPEGAFYRCTVLENIVLPLTLHHIGKEAFSSCWKLTHIDFPKKVCHIGDGAFSYSKLESFGVETENNQISNPSAFYYTPLLNRNDIVSTSMLSNELRVLYVSDSKAFKITADKVHFLPYSLLCGKIHIDLTDCKKISLSRNAVPRRWYDYQFTDKRCIIKLNNDGSCDSFAILPDRVDVRDSYDKSIDRKIFNIYGCNEDDHDDEDFRSTRVCVYELNVNCLPRYSLRTDYKKIEVRGMADIAEDAIDSEVVEEVKIDHFSPEGRIFTNNCTNLRKVTWCMDKDTITKYLPPGKLVDKYLKAALLNAFSPCSAPHGHTNRPHLPGYKRTVFNREVIDSIFCERVADPHVNPYFKRALPVWLKNKKTVTVSNKFKALVAVDVLRSDRMPHEPDTKMYYDFIMNHFGFCYKYFKKISGEFPEYAETLKKIRYPGIIK